MRTAPGRRSAGCAARSRPSDDGISSAAPTACRTLAPIRNPASPDVGFLIGARVLQAVGAALLIPSSLGLLLAAHPAERRPGAVRIYAAMSGVAAALGPVLGGLLVTASWRWIFLVNVPVGIAALVAGRRFLPSPPPVSEPLPDLVG